MLELNITIPGKPIAQKRVRKGLYGNLYNPQKKERIIFQRLIKEQLYLGFIPAEKHIPVTINVKAFFYPSKKEAKNKKFIELIKDDDHRYTKKPDKDNIKKFLMDAMNKIVYHDDSQVDGYTKRYYSLNPRTEIQIIF